MRRLPLQPPLPGPAEVPQCRAASRTTRRLPLGFSLPGDGVASSGALPRCTTCEPAGGGRICPRARALCPLGRHLWSSADRRRGARSQRLYFHAAASAAAPKGFVPPPELAGARRQLDGAPRSFHALGGLHLTFPALGRPAASPAIRRQLLRPRALWTRFSPVRWPSPAPQSLPRAVVFRENLWQRRHGNMFEQELATTNKFKNTRMQPSRARALTESTGASADAHHPFRPASRVPGQGPGTRVHGDALRPRTAAILTAPTDSSGKAQN